MDDLKSYIKNLLDKNIDVKKIKEDLVQLGWQEKVVEQTIGELLSQPPVSSTAPLPPTMREIFSGFLSLTLVWSSAIALGTLWFQIINKLLPDPLADQSSYSYWYYFGSTSDTLLRGAVATLIIMFPLFLLSIWFILRNFRNNPQQKESRLIKWFTYITLFFAASTAMNELISLIKNFLEGELGWRIFFRSLTVLFIAVLGITFYVFERRRIEFKKRVGSVVFVSLGAIAALAVIIGTIWGLALAGQPGLERMKKFDSQRVSNLSSLEQGINQFTYSKGKLPSDLDEFKNNSDYYYYARYANDPETNKPFDYRVISNGTSTATYELCANFSLSSSDEKPANNVYDYYSYSNSKWSKHDKGHFCSQSEAQLPFKQQQTGGQFPQIFPAYTK